MKSFVYTVVAATIAASSAAANSTDASTSGTVPVGDQSNYCEFNNVVDGAMSYVPGFHDDGNGNKGAGYWRTQRAGAAHITVKTRGASVISVMGGDRVINRNDPSTIYPVKVDYYTAQTNGHYSFESVTNHFGTDISNTTEVNFSLPGETEQTIDAAMGYTNHTWKSYSYRRVFTTKEQPNYADNNTGVEWGNYQFVENPNAMLPVDGNVPVSPLAHDQLNYHLKYTNRGAGLPNVEYEIKLAISGTAWMLGSDGVINYEDDGMGRRDEIGTHPDRPWELGRKTTHYGMTDGDYYIEHTVQCLQ